MARSFKAAPSFKGLGVLTLIGSPALIHLALFHSHSRVLPLALLVVQLGGLCVVLAGRARSRGRWLLISAIAGLAGLLAWRFGSGGVAISSGLTHAAIHIALLTLFGATLQSGREPLVTGLMRRIRGPLPPELVIYGRQVTMLWCGYFAAQLLVSLLLLLAEPLAVWSFFINVLNVPLVLTVFAGEIIYHTVRFRHLPRSRFVDLINAVASFRLAVPAEKSAAS